MKKNAITVIQPDKVETGKSEHLTQQIQPQKNYRDHKTHCDHFHGRTNFPFGRERGPWAF